MNSIKQFIYDFQNSFYNPEFYSSVHKRTFGSALLNLFFLGVISGLGVLLFLGLFIFPEAKHSNVREFATEIYPEDLVVTIQDGEASTNLSGPYIVPLPNDEVSEGEDLEADVVNLFVIDTSEEASIDDLGKYKTMGLLTKDKIVFNSGNQPGTSELQIIEVKDFDDMVIDEQFVVSTIDKFKTVYYVLMFVAALFILIFMTIALIASYLVLTLIANLATLITSKVFDLNYTFGEAYVVSMFAMIPVITYDLITDVLGVGNLFSLGALVFLAVIILNLKKKEVISNESV